MGGDPAVTLATETIHNPAEARHFMAVKPVAGRVTISRGGTVLADSVRAVRVLEVGKAMYDPVVYVPADDVLADLTPVEKATHCPLKGDASYYAVDGEEIAWSYESPFDFAADLTGLRAFWANKVTISVAPPDHA